MHPVLTAIWLLLPAYIANSTPVLLGGGPPVDGGRTWRGHRLLGDGKTWRGTAAGILAGIAAAALLRLLQASSPSAAVLPTIPAVAAVTLPAGALLGDMAASLLKRQLGVARGAPLRGVDQLDFVVGALLLTAAAAPGWMAATVSLPVAAAMLVATPVLHLSANRVAYWLGVKDTPW